MAARKSEEPEIMAAEPLQGIDEAPDTIADIKTICEKALAARSDELAGLADELADIEGHIAEEEKAMKAAVSANNESAYTDASTRKNFFDGRRQLTTKKIEELKAAPAVITEEEFKSYGAAIFEAYHENDLVRILDRLAEIRDELEAVKEEADEARAKENAAIERVNLAAGRGISGGYGLNRTDSARRVIDAVDNAFRENHDAFEIARR